MKITVYDYLGTYSLKPMNQDDLFFDVVEHQLSLPDGCTFETIKDGVDAGHEYIIFPDGARRDVDLDLIIEHETAYFRA